ncbi:MAG TPA: MFS transporter [Flavitalea sp.]|nr:MFS transporter [Flavitalea sp.]
MEQKKVSILNIAVIVAALGYFVDIYDLLLFAIIRIPSLRSLGLNDEQITSDGMLIINAQMIGLLIGGILWGILGDKKGRLKVLYASIIIYSIGNIANGFVQNIPQYIVIRFFTGLGLAGELGAGITLVSELLPKEKRGIGTSLVAGIGLTGAVVAFFIKENFDWRTCYFIGGGLGLMLLFLRVRVLESGMFNKVQSTSVSKGNFFYFFNNATRFKKYVLCILIGLPTWYVIGILISFSKEFGEKMNLSGAVDPGKAVMFAYAGISLGDIASGLISQLFRSRKKALYLFYALTSIGILLFFNLQGSSPDRLYAVAGFLGFATGFWAIFVTIAAEQFGTNIRATAATTVPNMVRGSLALISLFFAALQPSFGYVTSGWITGIVLMVITVVAAYFTEETFNKDLDYLET